MQRFWLGTAVSTLLCSAGVASAQSARSAIPVRTLTPAVSTDSGLIKSLGALYVLSDGHVLVLDRWRMTLFDSTLRRYRVLADTAADAPVKLSIHGVGLVPFRRDSSVYVDLKAGTLTVVAPDGTFGRTIAPPVGNDIGRLLRAKGFDPKGRIVYATTRPDRPGASHSSEFDEAGKLTIIVRADTVPILRGDFETRSVDTVAMFYGGVNRMYSVRLANGAGSMLGDVVNPLPQIDDWTLLPDGTIAIVRGQDYHIDWLGMDGKMTSTPKMPFDWKRISSEEKVALINSLKRADSTRRANAPPPGPRPAGAPPEIDFAKLPFMTVEPSELPDYYPPIRFGQVRSDPDGNVWILPSTSTLSQGTTAAGATGASTALVYDVVNRKGVIVERVKLPAGRNLVGLAARGVVVMTYAPAPGVVYVERARIIR
jgi:hypothetical protein